MGKCRVTITPDAVRNGYTKGLSPLNSGTGRDQTGAVMPTATVTLTNPAANEPLTGANNRRSAAPAL